MLRHNMNTSELIKFANSIREVVKKHYVLFQGVDYERAIPVIQRYFTDMSEKDIRLGIETVLEIGE